MREEQMEISTHFRGIQRTDAIALRGSVSPAGIISGTALHYNELNGNGWAVASGAIDLSGRLPAMLWSHDQSSPIGHWSSVTDVDNGLAVKGQLNLEVAQAREVLALLTHGDISGLSVGLSVEADDVKRHGDGYIFTKARLQEVSVVAVPADSEARISTVAQIDSIREFERFLRESGRFSRQFAAKLASRGWPTERTQQSDITEAYERVKALTARIPRITR